MSQTTPDAFALKRPTTALIACYKAQYQGSQIPHCFESHGVTKFLIAAEVFVLIPLNTTHLQGNPQLYQSSWGFQRSICRDKAKNLLLLPWLLGFSELHLIYLCFYHSSQTLQTTIHTSCHWHIPIWVNSRIQTLFEHTVGMYSGKGKTWWIKFMSFPGSEIPLVTHAGDKIAVPNICS